MVFSIYIKIFWAPNGTMMVAEWGNASRNQKFMGIRGGPRASELLRNHSYKMLQDLKGFHGIL